MLAIINLGNHAKVIHAKVIRDNTFIITYFKIIIDDTSCEIDKLHNLLLYRALQSPHTVLSAHPSKKVKLQLTGLLVSCLVWLGHCRATAFQSVPFKSLFYYFILSWISLHNPKLLMNGSASGEDDWLSYKENSIIISHIWTSVQAIASVSFLPATVCRSGSSIQKTFSLTIESMRLYTKLVRSGCLYLTSSGDLNSCDKRHHRHIHHDHYLSS